MHVATIKIALQCSNTWSFCKKTFVTRNQVCVTYKNLVLYCAWEHKGAAVEFTDVHFPNINIYLYILV